MNKVINNELHDTQGHILKTLLLCESARFSDLRPEKMTSDHFTFHLNRMVETGIVEKLADGMYQLTLAGKEFANRFDIDSGVPKTEKQAKLTVLVAAERFVDGKREYVMQTRQKHPFFGFKGFVTGKIKIGESVVETAARELEEETGLISKEITQKSVCHERIYSLAGELLEDKYLFICVAQNISGELLHDIDGGKNDWVAEADIEKGNIFYDIADLMPLIKTGSPAFCERTYKVGKY